MANANTVILIGNLTSDPQMKNTQSGTNVTTTGVAVTRKYKGQEEVSFFDIVAFGKTAETLNQYMKKGRPILVEGRLQLDMWEGKDGTKRSKHRVIVERFQFLGGGGQGGSSAGGSGGYQNAPQSQSAGYGEDGPSMPSEPYDDGTGEDIPF